MSLHFFKLAVQLWDSCDIETENYNTGMKKVLIYYRYFYTLGGAEYEPLVFIAELQKTCKVTLALDWTKRFEDAIKLFEVPIDLSKINVVQLMPANYLPTKHSFLLSFYRLCRLKKLAKENDVCISLANIIDFGRPAHHFITMLDFGDKAFSKFVRQHKFLWEQTALQKSSLGMDFIRFFLGIRSKKKQISDYREHIYPNSYYVEMLMKKHYGDFNGEVFYPPTIFEVKTKNIERDPLKIVYLGRISAEKKIIEIIEITEQVRKITGKDCKLYIAGQLDKSPYTDKLENIALDKKWIRLVGAVYGIEKERFLLSGTYSIHTMREEAFGISVTEYLKAGLIPIVPDEGGSKEVVDNPDLTYHDNEEAVRILVRLLSDKPFSEKQLLRCTERAKIFSCKAYMERQRQILKKIVDLNP
ncbi:MAG: glycosyltransferase [Lentisphaeria bacterium]|nr:glycosyltransferase [Lentisphaeria bacterium]